MKLFLSMVALFLLGSSAANSEYPLNWVKLGWQEEELPVIEMKINGRPVKAFFDTGADGIFMDYGKANKLGLIQSEPAQKQMGTFAGGKQSETFSADPVSLSVGSSNFAAFPVTILKSSISNDWYDMIVGVELLRRTTVSMNYLSRKMTVLTKPTISKNQNAVRLPVEFLGKSHIMIVKAKLGLKGVYLHFDTGGTFALNVFASAADMLGLRVVKNIEGGKGGSGEEVSQIIYDKPVKACLGAICETVKPIGIKGQEAMWTNISKKFGKAISGQISHHFLLGKVVEYDLANKNIWVLRARENEAVF